MNMRLFLTLLFLPLSLFGQSAAERRTPLERSLEQRGLVDVSVAVPGVFVSLMYARPDNFVGRVLYTDLHRAYLLPETARALHRAQTALQRKYPDYALKVYDAARPMRIQQRMWNAVAGTSKNIYVSNPARGGGLHNYGLAVDLTLCWARDVRDGSGRLLHAAAHEPGFVANMSRGTEIVDGRSHGQTGGVAGGMEQTTGTIAHIRLRRILREAMSAGGFRVLPTEWWHFNFKTRAQARAHYTPIL